MKILGSLLASRPGPGREFANAPAGKPANPGSIAAKYARTGRTKRWQVYPLPPKEVIGSQNITDNDDNSIAPQPPFP